MSTIVRRTKSLISLLLAASIALSLCAAAWADDEYPAYFESRIYIDGLLADRGYLYISSYYMPLDSLCLALGINTTAERDGDEFTLSGDGFELKYHEGNKYVSLNGRYFYSDKGVITVRERICVPVLFAEKMFNVYATIENRSIIIDATDISLIQSADQFYGRYYSDEELYWLTQIIHAEGYGEPLMGKVAVGNVVLNRVAHKDYPDTIPDVVFDDRFGVQFATTLEDEIYADPIEDDIAAASLCLEGLNNIGECMFFVNPEYSSTKWFDDNLIYYDTIGSHQFYYLEEEME